MKKFYIETLGCKVNQYESDGIAADLESKGWMKGNKNDLIDLCIINTCAVTAKAGMQSRQAIRKLIRKYPDAKIIVTGCHAQTSPNQIKKIDHIDHIVSHRDKTKIAESIENNKVFNFRAVDHTKNNRFRSFSNTVMGNRTRAYLKIQDGCNSFCSYCIVPHGRGSSVSMPEKDVFSNLKQLSQSGFKEVILTGINTGLYGHDLNPETNLVNLIKKMDSMRPVERIRLSSIEPQEMKNDLIELADSEHILCDHFHIPLQAGDNRILQKMKRPYQVEFFQNLIQNIYNRIPFCCIGVDTLIGFPTETEQEFQNTYDIIEKLPISYLHIFPFSPRPGTPAFHLKPKIDVKKIKERCMIMKKLDYKKRKNFIKANQGHQLQAIIQYKTKKRKKELKAVTSNYLTISLEGEASLQGKMVDITLEQYDNKLNLFGKIVN